MLDNWVVMIAIGTVLGFLSGIGVGGGSLLMLWLTLVLQIPHSVARNINLLFFIPSALIASFFRKKQGALDLKRILPAIAGASLCAALFSWVSQHIDIHILKRLFGILLLITGVRELFYRPRKAK